MEKVNDKVNELMYALDKINQDLEKALWYLKREVEKNAICK